MDVIVDLLGWFLPLKTKSMYWLIKAKLVAALNAIFSSLDANFLSLRPFRGLKVIRGSNDLDSCY